MGAAVWPSWAAELYGEVDDMPVNVEDGECMLVRPPLLLCIPLPLVRDAVADVAIVAADGERLCDILCSDLTDSGVWDFIDGLLSPAL